MPRTRNPPPTPVLTPRGLGSGTELNPSPRNTVCLVGGQYLPSVLGLHASRVYLKLQHKCLSHARGDKLDLGVWSQLAFPVWGRSNGQSTGVLGRGACMSGAPTCCAGNSSSASPVGPVTVKHRKLRAMTTYTTATSLWPTLRDSE